MKEVYYVQQGQLFGVSLDDERFTVKPEHEGSYSVTDNVNKFGLPKIAWGTKGQAVAAYVDNCLEDIRMIEKDIRKAMSNLK